MNKKVIVILGVFLVLFGGFLILFIHKHSRYNGNVSSDTFYNNKQIIENKKVNSINTQNMGANTILNKKKDEFRYLMVTKNGQKYFKTVYGEVPLDKIKKLSKKYGTMSEFLKDVNKLVKNITGLNLDLTKDDFVICFKSGGSTLFLPTFRQKDISKGKYDTKYKYLRMYEIYKAIKSGCILGGYNSNAKSKYVTFEDFKHPEEDTIKDIIHGKINVYSFLNKFKSYKRLGYYDTLMVSVLNDFIGNYEKANELKEKALKKKDSVFSLFGQIVDENGKPIKGAKVILLNDPSVYAISDKDGKYNLTFKYYRIAYFRFKVQKEGYSDSFFQYYYDMTKKPWSLAIEKKFTLVKHIKKYTIDWGNYKNIVILYGKKYYLFEGKQATYLLPVDGLYYMNGNNKTKGKVHIYLFNFNRDMSKMIFDLLTMDVFAGKRGLVGNAMLTYGMPYITIYDGRGKELYVHKSNPMIVRYKGTDFIRLLKADNIDTSIVNKLIALNKKGGYPITYDYLFENGLNMFPKWWVIDRKKGLWENVPYKILNKNGLTELMFYEINDNN